MDDRRFDDVIKVMTHRFGSRRTLGGGLLAALLSRPVTAEGKPKRGGKGGNKKSKGKVKSPGKKPPQQRPEHLEPPPGPGEDECESFFTDPELVRDCKAIRRTCRAPEYLCLHAVDSPGDDDRGVTCCPEHKTCCIFGCVDARSDAKNCNRCGNECGPEQTCRNGECVCDDSQCLPGGTCCGEGCCGGPNFPYHRCCDGQCLDTGRDPANCGQCGNACGAGQMCSNGQCVCNDAACPHGQLCLDNAGFACADPAVNGCRCWCGPIYKYCPNQFGGACVSPNAVCA